MGGEWLEVSLGDLFNVKHGFAFKGEYFTDEPTESLLVTPGNFAIGGGFQNPKPKYYNGPIPDEYVLIPGQIVVTMTDLSKQSDTLGLAVIIPDDSYKWLHNQRVGLLEFRKNYSSDPKFINYLLRTHKYRSWVIGSATGTTVKHTSPSRIQTYTCSIPPIDEQKSIAHILGSLDDKIELNRQMNATLEAMAQALFKSWFVDFDPVIDNALAAGNPIPDPLHARAETRKALGDKRKPLPEMIQKQFPSRFVFSQEMGWIPEGWEIASIGEICEVIDCLHSKKPTELEEDTGNILLQLNNIRDDGLLDLKKKYFISDDDYKKWISRIEVREGDCVITNVGRVGAVSIVPRGVLAAIGRNITAIRLRECNELKAFMITLLSSQYMGMEIDRRTDVGTILNALNVKSIPQLRFLNAGQILEAFEKQVFPILKKRQDMLDENIVLSGLRDILLPKLLFGQLRIPDAEKLVADVV